MVLLVLDLAPGRRSQSISLKRSLIWSAIWVTLAATFAAILHWWQGGTTTLEFSTAYLIELSLSVDNLFVFLLIFRHFNIPLGDQHKVLLWGIVGAMVMRGIFIFAGVGLLRKFDWLVYVFGAFLILSGLRLFVKDKSEIHPEKSRILKLFQKFIPVTEDTSGDSFFIRRSRLYATPLFLVLVLIETADLLFALDSIPAVLAISRNFMIVFTSNILAILGLRSMYFALAGVIGSFKSLHYGLSAVLIFVGIKMLIGHYHEIPTAQMLAAVGAILLISVLVSLFSKTETHPPPPA
jgi:tellurite resistance protein TerC